MATTVLPPGPYPLKSGYVTRRVIGGGILVLLSAFIIIGVLWWQGGEGAKLWGEGAIIAHGVQVPAAVEGTKKSNHFIFNDYDLNVDYLDQDGARHTHKLKLYAVLSSIDDGVQPTVYYMPDHPDRFVLSWAHSIKGGRWAAIIFFILVALVMGAGAGAGGVATLRQIGNARRALAGHAVEVTSTEIKTMTNKGKDTGGREYHYTGVDPSGVAFNGHALIPLKKGSPLWTDKAQTRFVMLCGSEKASRLVVRSDFYPLDLGEAEQRDYRAHLERRERGTL